MTPDTLRTWRKNRRLSQTQAAALLSVTSRQWQRYEAGQADIPQAVEMALGYYTLTGQTRFPPVAR